MILAEGNPPSWTATLAVLGMLAGGIGLLCTILMVIYMKRQTDLMAAANTKPEASLPQPLAVELVEELHEQFADKAVFEKHCEGNTQRHSQLFTQIENVERVARKELEKRVTEINADRARTQEKINEQIERNAAACRHEDALIRKEFSEKFDALRKELGEWTGAMNRALGRLEGDDNK